MTRSTWLVTVCAAYCALAAWLAFPQAGTAQETPKTKICWIYKDVPGLGEPDLRSPPERLFQPYFFMPEIYTNRIRVNAKFPVDRLDPQATGSCVEMTFGLPGADKWVAVGFTPDGVLPGDREGWNVARDLLVETGTPVHLRFRARAAAEEGQKNTRVFVRFETGGTAGPKGADGITLPLAPSPELTVLTPEWRDVSIDLTRKASRLDSVICPLKVIVRCNENPGKEDVTIYVDDIRYEVGTSKNNTK